MVKNINIPLCFSFYPRAWNIKQHVFGLEWELDIYHANGMGVPQGCTTLSVTLANWGGVKVFREAERLPGGLDTQSNH